MSEFNDAPPPVGSDVKVYPPDHELTNPALVAAAKDSFNEKNNEYANGYDTQDIHRRSQAIVDNGFEWMRSGLITEEELKTYLAVEMTTLELKSYTDSLTELKNRLGFLDQLSTMVSHAKRSGESVGVVYLDLDGFKQTNDDVGHNAGDESLKVVAEIIREMVRVEDAVARLGGDEFAIALAGDPSEIKNRLIELRKSHFSDRVATELKTRGVDLGNIKIGFSIGASSLSDEITDVPSLVKSAENEMKKDKEEKLQRNPNAQVR